MSSPSEQDLFNQGRAELLRIRPELACVPGDVTEMPIWAAVAMGSIILARIGQGIAETFLDGAEGAALAKLVRDHWGIEKKVNVKAIGTLSFTHAAGPTGTIPAGTRVATEPDDAGNFQTALTDTALVFGAGNATLSVTATAQKAGRAGNVDAAAYTRILDPLFHTFTVTNAARFVGGAEDETDEELREQARGFNRSISRGTLAALEYGAKRVATVRTATASEDEQTGLCTIYVADADGNANSAMVAAVQAEIENWRAASSVVTIVGGTVVNLAITVRLTVRTGVSITALADRVREAVVGATNRGKHGQTWYQSLGSAAARSVDQQGIVEAEIETPGAHVAPAANEVIRTTPDLVTVTG